MQQPSPPRPRLFEVVVREVVVEAPGTTTLVFDVLGEASPYRPGQFLTIDPHQFKALAAQLAFLEERFGRRQRVRAYSMASAPHEPLAITVKEEPYIPKVSRHPALLSPLLVHAVPVGTQLQVFGFTGPYNLPPDIEERTDHLVHLVAGSGVVPNWSILKFALREHPRLRHTFIFSNTVWEEVIFREALTALAAANPQRLRVVHTLTRQGNRTGVPPEVRTGRVNLEMLSELLPDSKTAIAYVCGPAIAAWDRRAALDSGVLPTPRFLETVLGCLEELGFEHARIRHESYG